MRVFTSLIVVSLLSGGALARDDPQTATIEFQGEEWTYFDFPDDVVRVENYLGRESLFIGRNSVARADLDLADLVIEYDYASTHESGFIGVNFRFDLETNSFEQFYTRPHQSGQPDATQYMVAINGSATWQLHAGPNEAVATDLAAQEWIPIRIVVIGDQADIFVDDMETPLIHVPDLRFDGGRGLVSLYASDRPFMPDTGAYFSNVRIREANSEDQIIGTPRETDPLPVGLISEFMVSNAFAETELDGVFSIADFDLDSHNWNALGVESDGVANLARIAGPAQGANTVFVRMSIDAEEATERMMMFGYSDRVRLYVNGEQVYFGNAQWRSRDHRFLGTVALADGAALHLREGRNEIVAAVSESFGGWGFKAQIEDQSGLVID